MRPSLPTQASSSSPVRVWSAMPSSSLCGSAPPRPAPVLWCLARPAVPQCRRCLLAARPRACKPVRTKGRRRRPSIFCMIFHLTRARAVGSAWCRLEATTPYYAKPAVESAWEHEPSLSSHDATASLSLLRKKDDFAKLRRGEDGQHGRCTCPKWISGLPPISLQLFYIISIPCACLFWHSYAACSLVPPVGMLKLC